MYNKISAFARRYQMFSPGDRVICAVSGGADSVALLLAFHLLRDTMDIQLEAAHFNHGLRGEESDADEAFVKALCAHYDVPLHLGSGQVVSGKKGLEAAAREARYGFLRSLGGKIATAHTADDNAETVLMHLVRGTGLKGLGGITPVSGNVIRPMLSVTRQEVEVFLQEYCQRYRTDSSNLTDAFLRNRLRRQVMPLLHRENPRIAESVSAMALRLREDEALIESLLPEEMPDVEALREMPKALRGRLLERFLRQSGVKEPEQTHIALLEQLVFSGKPSASASFPSGVVITRCYDRLEVSQELPPLEEVVLSDGLELQELGLRVRIFPADAIEQSMNTYTVVPQGDLLLRCRAPGDTIRLAGGSRELKKLFIDRKIPAKLRCRVPVVADQESILGVYGIGVNLDRAAHQLPAVTVCLEPIEKERKSGG